MPAPRATTLITNPEIERNLGEQPIARIMQEHNLKAHDLVAISAVEMTHKMRVQRVFWGGDTILRKTNCGFCRIQS